MLKTNERTETAAVLAAMLTENTGTNFLDSGGIAKYDADGNYVGSDCGYGRHWQRNQHRDFDAEPATVLSFKYGIDVTHNVYHWLLERLEYDDELQDRFDEFVEDHEDTYCSGLVGQATIRAASIECSRQQSRCVQATRFNAKTVSDSRRTR